MNRPIDGIIYIPNNVFIVLCDIVLNVNDDQGFVHFFIVFLLTNAVVEFFMTQITISSLSFLLITISALFIILASLFLLFYLAVLLPLF